MDVTATANTVYQQYSTVLDQLKSGKISAREAYSHHAEAFSETRGLRAFVARRGIDLVQSEMTPEMDARISDVRQVLLAQQEHANADMSVYAADHTSKPPSVPAAPVLPRIDPTVDAVDAVEEHVLALMASTQADMADFLPFVEDMEKAGVSIEALAGSLIYRDGDGDFKVVGEGQWARDVEAFINGTPGVKALYARS